MIGILYKIYNTNFPNEAYIGSTGQRLSKRASNHLREFRKGVHSCSRLQDLFLLEGEQNLKIELCREIQVSKRVELYYYEEAYMDFLESEGVVILNTNRKVRKGDSSSASKITSYDKYLEVMNFIQYDSSVTPLAGLLKMHPTSLYNLIHGETYLDYREQMSLEGVKRDFNLYLSTALEIKKQNIEITKGLSTLDLLIMMSLEELVSPMSSDYNALFGKEDSTRPLTYCFKEAKPADYAKKAIEVYSELTYLEKLLLLEKCLEKDIVFHPRKGKAVGLNRIIIANYLKENKRTRKEIALMMGVSESTISNYTSRAPRGIEAQKARAVYDSLSTAEKRKAVDIIYCLNLLTAPR